MCHRWKRRYSKQFANCACPDPVLILLLLFSYYMTESAAAPGRQLGKGPPFDDTLISYLTQFGYLPESDRETGYLRTDVQLRQAVKQLQHFANIPVTGELDSATRRMMSRPRCGVPDINMEDSKRKRSLRTKFFVSGLDRGRLRYDLSKALQIWARHSKLQFREINSDDADILVYFEKGYHGDGYPFDGLGQILAHAFFPGSGRGGDVHFDIEEIWQLIGDDQLKEDGTSLFAVAAHEFGHSLGLSHSSVPGALMYPWYQGLKEDYDLPDDDKYGIQQIYGANARLWGKNYGDKPGQKTTLYPSYTPRPSTTTTTTSSTTTASTTTHRPTTPKASTPILDLDKPNKCNTSYDAISIIRGEVFVFRGKYMWRIGDRGLYQGYPAMTSRLWVKLPKNLTHVDAVYERHDKKIVFFIGKLFYVFQAVALEPGYPKPLTALGLPSTLDKIDAAMIWGHNSKTYLFSGTMYWRLEDDGQVELDYPRDMSVWRGVGYNIDTVFLWKDGSTYFFKGTGFWKFNDMQMRVINEKPLQSSKFWFGCPAVESEDPIIVNSLPTDKPKYRFNRIKDSSSANTINLNMFVMLTSLTLPYMTLVLLSHHVYCVNIYMNV
ncbi:matrix metalloproteinase-2-like isoform X2 [Rhodnius prolixus]|uniref:matrix metalloproteinase-2-like isoform X2 n=1 Tax=Rhodnius prolixus TaxID=13249 RepID=UPI003D18A89B